MVKTCKPSRLIAHRGYARRYPENSILGIRAAIDAGARWIEVDVQMIADSVLVLHHDADLTDTAGTEEVVMDLNLVQLRELSFNERQRFGDAFTNGTIATVTDLVTLMQQYPGVTAFVELKRESLNRFGVENVTDHVMAEWQSGQQQLVLISFDNRDLYHARNYNNIPLGLVLDAYDADSRQLATRLAPEYLFCDHRLLSDLPAFWEGF